MLNNTSARLPGPQQVDRYSGIKLDDMDIDIAFLNEDFSKIENAELARQFINAKYSVAMHLPDSVAKNWLHSFKDRPDLFINPFIFSEKMEKKIFFTDQ
jgi:hypothetical protein